jgi:uncharacterized membrane-anchored protein YjiN (DUF445 family)
VKDFIELATPIYQVLEEYPCIKKEFKKATSEVRQIREQNQLRKYKPRELKQIAALLKSDAQNPKKSELPASEVKNSSIAR